ncbi:MAG: PRC-barrel domain-containing protein [Christensenellales bacterium]|jgi:YlmC/YmxH family sporulation protein
MTFSELRQKDVINICDGRRLGRPYDVCLNERACIEAIIVPEQCGVWGIFKLDRDGLLIPWEKIRRIGDDVILVELDSDV